MNVFNKIGKWSLIIGASFLIIILLMIGIVVNSNIMTNLSGYFTPQLY